MLKDGGRAFTMTIGTAQLLCGFCVLVRAFPVQGADFETPIAIEHATVIPRPGEVLTEATIILEGGRIKAVDTSVDIPPDARVINGTGLWAYAGFIDAVSHLGIAADMPGEEEMARLSDDEQDVVQGPRTSMQLANRKGVWPHRTIRDLYKADDKKIEAFRKAGFTAALLTPHPAILGGRGDVVQLSGGHLRAATLKPNVSQIVAFGGPRSRASFTSRQYPGSVMGVVALLRQTFMDAEWYRQGQLLYARHPTEAPRIPYDPVLEHMGRILDREERWIFLANAASEIHHALDLAREFNQDVVIFGGREAWKVADRLVAEGVPVIASLDFEKKPLLAPKKKSAPKEGDEALAVTDSWSRDWEDGFFEPLAVRKERVRLWAEQVNNLHTLLTAGIPTALTGRDLKSPAKLIENLHTALEEGLTADEALAALTTHAAAILGVSDQLGSIAPGKTANLTFLTKALEDKKAKVRYVFVDGELHRFAVGGGAKKDGKEADEDEADGPERGEEESEPEEEKEDPEDPHPWRIETRPDRTPAIRTGGVVLLKNASVITVTGGTRHDTDVLVIDGRIRSIGRDLQAPEDTREFDLTGYWVMPGIVDPHSHMGARGGINESTQSITSEVRIADSVDPSQLSLYRALAGGVTTIHTMHGSANAIGGQNAVMKVKYDTTPADMIVTTGPRLVKFALGENPTRAGRSRRRFPGTRMGMESVYRQAFNDALEYRRIWREYAEKNTSGQVVSIPRRDLRLESLNDILNGDIWVHSHCYRADEMLRLLAVAEDYGFRIGTLQHVLEGYRVTYEMFNHGVGGSTFSDWWGYKKEAYDAIPYNAAMMAKAGIVTSLNSDSADVVRYLNLEAGKTLRYGGLTAREAIKLVTINPAIQIGLSDRIGSIEVGKDGDFAVFSRHPLDTFARCVMTLIEGEVYFQHPVLIGGAIPAGPGSDFVPKPPRGLMSVPDNPDGFYAITGATIHPIASPPIEDGVIVMRNGFITAVAPKFTPPEDATVLDGRGLHVYPGLINAASQVGLVEINSIDGTVDTTEIARFQPDIRAVSGVNPQSAHVAVSLCEGITTSAVFPRGGVVSGRGGLVQLTGWTLPEMQRGADLGLVVNLPSLRPNLDEEDRKKRIDEHEKAMERVEAFFKKAQHYAKVSELEGPMAKDVQLEAMKPYVRGEKPVYFRASTYKKIIEAIRFSETFNLDPVVLGGGEAWKCAEILAEKHVPVIVTTTYTLPSGPFDPFDAYYANAAALEKAGVNFCIATDGSAYAKRLPVHAGMAIAHGLSEGRGVRSITLDAARILGIADEVGSLETGKTADVIVTTGNPCQASTRTVAAFVSGQPVELTSLHEQHFEKWTHRPRPELSGRGELRGPPPMRQ